MQVLSKSCIIMVMEKREIKFTPIGVVHTEFKQPQGTPIQPSAARGAKGRVEVFPEYEEALSDLEGFSHIILLCHLNLAGQPRMSVKPFLDSTMRGLFATRAPSRPNPIGLSIVRLLSIDGCTLHIQDLDLVDGTPLLDIKPFVPSFDCRPEATSGWLEHRIGKQREVRDDGRFMPEKQNDDK